MSKTQSWFDDRAVAAIRERYASRFQPAHLSYATVQDFCDSFDQLRPLATANQDLKDVQRPWMLKAILGIVPPGGRVLEVGAGEPWVADLLSRLGYQAWVVDPYDGSGNGPLEFEVFSAQAPQVRFIRDQFSERVHGLEPNSFDCIYSISVLEHIPPAGLRSVADGIKRFLKPGGKNIHAVDHVHKGNGAASHLTSLELMVELFGLPVRELSPLFNRMSIDTDTYYLSAESHNCWRGSIPYREFPMRVCVSVQLCA